VLRWAAVLGSAFGVDRLGELMALDLDRLLAALELLERHALLRPHGDGAGAYEFATTSCGARCTPTCRSPAGG